MTPHLWKAPSVNTPVDATVTVPGSKSLTNRYLVAAALASAPSIIRSPLRSRDTELMADALRSLGTTITTDNDHEWCIAPPDTFRGSTRIDCGLAGTVMRFIPPLAALAIGPVRIDGDKQAYGRPMSPVIDGLTQLGVNVQEETPGHLPFTVEGTGHVRGGVIEIDASASSQFVSGLLLAGARFDHGLTIRHSGGAVPSLPHIAMTIDVLRSRGVIVDQPSAASWQVLPGTIEPAEVTVEPDLSNAGPFLAAAMVTGGCVRIPSWPQHTTQAGDALRAILANMGADISLTNSHLAVHGGDEIRGLNANLHEIGELAPTIAALAALASTPSTLSGIGHLRGHETDRLAALTTELNRLGGNVEEGPDFLHITPAPLHSGTWRSYADHRMATAGAILGLAVPGVLVEDIATTAKTLPDFPHMWTKMLR